MLYKSTFARFECAPPDPVAPGSKWRLVSTAIGKLAYGYEAGGRMLVVWTWEKSQEKSE